MKKDEMVKLISAEGFEFVIDLKAAMLSQTLGSVLTFSDGIMEKGHGELRLREISTPILEKICQYLYWALRFASVEESDFHIEPEIALELAMAANYLEA
ncbi:S-phase kinase-associated protein 1-like protein [Dioscorea alata]|uniref:S-phase kinase-associated protein 1-like protein n=1 Tax=Dioscorea alata TaxID=55571 RepID=A0ACB7VU82_DIOAL|nr:S-phase kinase-associated protein 1-like protein [Dioscorea alata]